MGTRTARKITPRVLIACEMSGRVRTQFAKRGWDAWSCDLLPDESAMWCPEGDGACSQCDPCWGNHYQGDVFDIIGEDWNLVIEHPPCTDLSQAGARYWKQKQEDGRQKAAIQFFLKLHDAPRPQAYVATENPVGVMNYPPVGREPDQIVQPWMFGDPLTKRTCLWFRPTIGWDMLPLLQATHSIADYPDGVNRVTTGGGSWRTDAANGRTGMNRAWEDSQGRARRDILRSITPEGFAKAAADQWGAYVEQRLGL